MNDTGQKIRNGHETCLLSAVDCPIDKHQCLQYTPAVLSNSSGDTCADSCVFTTTRQNLCYWKQSINCDD
eukprot:scaffold284897_cov36-Prasinocladus_malaysianus.AAC.1